MAVGEKRRKEEDKKRETGFLGLKIFSGVISTSNIIRI